MTVTVAPPAGGLNPAQRRVVDHEGRSLLVLAGAGTGKTKTLAARVAGLLERGVAPERILLLTFSRRAAAEMLRRAGAADPVAARRVWGGTFHAIGYRLLRTYGSPLGLDAGFSVLDQGDAAELMALVRGERVAAERRRRFPRQDTLLAIYSRVVNSQQPLADTLERAFPWCAAEGAELAEIFDGYTDRKRAHGLLDFDDLLLFWAAATADARVGPILAGLFDHVLVDEYQDTNVLQADIVAQMTRDGAVMVVGDDAQAIYSFRAATVRNILDFADRYPATEVVALEENYRSTPAVLAVANSVMADAVERHEKQLWSRRRDGRRPRLVTCLDEQTQADAVCDAVLGHREEGVALLEQAVLFRAAHHSDLLELELRRRNIPFVKYGGLRFLESAHLKDLLAVLRVLDNPRDELAWFRTLRLADGVGPAVARRLLGPLGVRPPDDDPTPAGERLDRALPHAPRSARSDLGPLAAALDACADEARVEPTAQVRRLREALDPLVRRHYANADARVRDLEELEHVAASYPTRGQLVAELVLDPPGSTSDLAGPPSLDEDYLVLSTVHSAKGGEWDAVHVIHVADGMFPSDLATRDPAEIEEERRLFYVAVTRARDHLHLYFPLRYFHRRQGLDDAHHYAQLTRFVSPEVLGLFDRDQRGAEPVALEEGPLGGAGRVGAVVARSLRSLWR